LKTVGLALLAFSAVVFSSSADIRGVTGYGSFPVTVNTQAFWLLREDGTPLVMVYYHGQPAQWADTHWKIDSLFTQSAVGWAELKSAKAVLHLRVDLGAGRAEVQHKSFSLAQNNTFLVVHTTNPQQKVISLGHRKLLKTGQNPAAVMLLDSDTALKNRIAKETGGL
jgi:hypothetical protein